MTFRYRNTQSGRIRIPDAYGVEVDPGEEFDSPELLNNPTLVPADTATKAAHKALDASAPDPTPEPEIPSAPEAPAPEA